MPINFDLAALRAMASGIDLGGFAHAAQRLNRSQSAVSMQLRKLEKQAGQRLFKRQGRGLVLTDAGQVLLAYARRLLVLNDEAAAALGGHAFGGTVRIGMPQDFADFILPKLLARFREAQPDMHVEVKAGRNYSLAEDVTTGRLDVALIFAGAGRGARDRVARLPCVWIGRAPDENFERNDRSLPLIAFDSPCLFRQLAVDVLDRAGLPWKLVLTTPSLTSVWAGVQAGLGVTVRTPLSIPKSLHILPFGARLPRLHLTDVRVLCAKEPGVGARDMNDILRETVELEIRGLTA